jgi:hypothetical protein
MAWTNQRVTPDRFPTEWALSYEDEADNQENAEQTRPSEDVRTGSRTPVSSSNETERPAPGRAA